MGTLSVKKVNTEPTAPYTPNTMYIIREPLVVPEAIGWRLYLTEYMSTQLGMVAELDFVGSGNGGAAFANQKSQTYWDRLFDSDLVTAYQTTDDAVGNVIGMVFPVGHTVDNISLTSPDEGGARMISGFTVQYSHDTTTGLDGTWTDLNAVTGEVGWGVSESRTYPTATLGDTIKVWVSSTDGNTVSKSIHADLVNEMIESSGCAIVASDIGARDNLAPLTNLFVLVEDATGDPQAPPGPVVYLWVHTESTYYRMAGAQIVTMGQTEW